MPKDIESQFAELKNLIDQVIQISFSHGGMLRKLCERFEIEASSPPKAQQSQAITDFPEVIYPSELR